MLERSQDKVDRLHQRLVDEVHQISHPQAKVRRLLAFAKKTIVMLVNLEDEREDYIAERNRLAADHAWAQSAVASLDRLEDVIDTQPFFDGLEDRIIEFRDAHPRCVHDAPSSEVTQIVIDYLKTTLDLDTHKDLK